MEQQYRGLIINRTLICTPYIKKTRCFVFPFIPQYGRSCWRCSHASDTAFPPPGSPAHGWMLLHTLFSCFTRSSAVVAGAILLTLSCSITQIFPVGLRSGLFSGHTTVSQKPGRCYRHNCYLLWAVCGENSSRMKTTWHVSAISERRRTPPSWVVRLIASKDSLAMVLVR